MAATFTAKYDKATRSVVVQVTPDKKLHPRSNSSLHHLTNIASVEALISQLNDGVLDWAADNDTRPIEL